MKIDFVCFGNICRSPMAEFVMKNLVAEAGLAEKISVESAGCHTSIDSPISSGTCQQLQAHNIPFEYRTARQLLREDYRKFDYIIGMDKSNVRDIKKITGGDPDNKIFLMMEFAGEKDSDVDDPYMTDNYARTYEEISRACKGLLERVAAEVQS